MMKKIISSQNQAIDLKTRYQTVLKSLLTAFLLLCSMGVWGQTTLPFIYDGGKPSSVQGLTHSGLGTDYGSTQKMKFDDTGDFLILNFIGTPGTLSFNVKWNAGSTPPSRFPGDFVVEESSDGTIYTVVQLYNSTNGTTLINSISIGETFSTLNFSTRFIRWKYSSKLNGNIALGNINLKAPTSYAPTVTTTSATSVTETSASSGGNVTADGGAAVSARGVFFGTTATPTSGTSDGTGTGAFTSSLSSLSVNTQYYYRAFATNSAGTSYGSESSFYTLANVPSAPTVATPTSTSLNVSVNANGNPASTEYAIHETGGNFVQANGSLGAAAVWQTAATWGTKTVTGLLPATTYTFETKARNGADVETAYSGSASGTTNADQVVDFNKIQFPVTEQTITVGGTLDVYTRAYEPGLTTNTGAQASLKGWVGYSSSNDNPANTGWTWVVATFNAEIGNDDEYKATLSGLPVGTYYFAGRFQIGTGSYAYGGADTVWNNNSVKLNVAPDVVDYCNIQSPFTGNITEGTNFDVYAQVYEDGITNPTGQGAGITAEIGYSTTNGTPDGTWTWLPATYNGDGTGANANNDEYKTAFTGLAPGIYYYASRFKKSGSSVYKYGGTGGVWNNDSGILTVNSDLVEWGNYQSPTTGTYTTGGIYDVYGRVRVLGVTPGAGQGTGITAEVGYNTTNNNPNSAGWTWVAAQYNAFGPTDNEDEYMHNMGGELSTPGTYFLAFRYKKLPSDTWYYAGHGATPYSGGTWDGITNVNAEVTVIAKSTASDIVVKSGYTYPQNIPYANYQATNITGGTNDIEIAQFIIRDGGETADADNLGTTLNQLTLNITNSANIRRIALYDGVTEIAEQAGAATTTFTGLNLSAPDNGTKDFSVRVSFNTAVADNQQIQLTIAAATSASALGSTFIATNAGGAATSVALDDNRIEVTADRLAFFQQPSNANVNVSMTPAVTLSANDINANRDLDFTNIMTITSTGTLNVSPTNATAIKGLATFNAITHSAQGTGLSMHASSTGVISASSTNFDITFVSAATDRFRTKGSGNWSSASTWESSSDGVIWVNPSSLAPTASASSIEILNTHTVTTTTAATANNLLVKSGGVLTLNSQITNNGNFKIENAGTVIVDYTIADLSTNIWKGNEDFEPESIVIFKLLNSSANLFTFSSGVPVITPRTYDGYTALFGQLVLKASNGWSSFLPTNANYNLTHKDLEIDYTALSNFSLFSGNSITMGIGRDFIVNTNNSSFNVTYQTGAGTSTLKIRRNFIKNGTGTGEFRFSSWTTSSSNNINFNIDGDLTVNNGVVNMIQGVSGGSIFTLNLKGNLNVFAGRLYNSNTSSYASCAFNFSGTDEQTVNYAPNTSFSYIPIYVKSGASVKLINQNLSLGTSSNFNVLDGGTLDFGFNGSTALNIDRVSGQTLQAFNAQAGSTLKITSPAGIVSGSTTPATDLYKGNVQIGALSISRVFDSGATYHYIGKVSQATGNGLPQGLTNKLIVELDTDSTLENLNFTSTGTTTFGTSTGVNGTLEIRRGRVIDIPNNGFRNYNGTVDENQDGEADPQKGNLVITGGRYVVSGGGTKPNLTGSYTLSAGTVEFSGSSATKIRTSSPPKQYNNVDVSGTNVETGGKNFIVNNLLKVTSPMAVLTIPETPLDLETPYVVTAKNGLQVLAGKALFKNNANLMQETAANNIGNIIMDRKTKMVKMDYTYWSSPVAGQRLTNTINPNLETSSGGFSPGTPNSRIFEYVEATDLFKATLDANFVAGKGYAIRGKNSFGTTTPTEDIFQFEGNPNNGNSISFNITKSPNSIIEGISYEHGYNIIGNPYPSNINFAKFYDLNKAVINAKAWYWTNASPHLYMEGSTYNGNNYATVTLAGGVPPTYIPSPSTGSYKPTNIIKIGQGFIIQAKAVPTSVQQNFTISFNNDIREAGIGVFYNNVGKLAPEHRYWLRMKSPSDIVNTILIGHFPNATDGYDANYDAELFTLGDDSLYSILDESKLQIQAKGDFQEDAQFILGTQFAQAGIYRFELEDPEGVFANDQSIYLYDKLKNTYTNLSQNSYQFETGKGKAEGRFEIVYKPGTTLVTDNRVKGLVQVYLSNDYFVVKSSDSKIEEIEIYDATGRLYQKVKGGTEEVKIDAAPLTNGLYVLKIKRKNETISKKIIK